MKYVPVLHFRRFEQAPEELAVDDDLRDLIDIALEEGLSQEGIERVLKDAHAEVEVEEKVKEEKRQPWKRINPLM